MFAGHVGIALGLGRAERQVNADVCVTAALLPDLLLWLLVIAGAESLVIPPAFATTHQAQFQFPYSHGLLASLAWSALAVECALTLAGVLLFLAGSMLSRGRATTLAGLTIVVAIFPVIGMTSAPPPPSATAMAVGSLITLCIVCALYGWLGRLRP